VRPVMTRRMSRASVGVAVVAAAVATGASGISGSDTITTIAGNGKPGFSGDGGPATSAQLRSVDGLAVDRQGNVYIADSANYRVRKLSPGGTISTFAGKGGAGGALGDGGQATAARLGAPRSVAVDGQGNVYIADYNAHRVRMVRPNGTITTFAGTGQASFSGDGGPAAAARLYAPAAVAVDGQGNVYIVDSYNQRVRKVSTDGRITTIAGTGKPGVSGDGGPATSATMTYPYGVAVDAPGNVYVSGDGYVRKVSREGTITKVAGGGSSFGDGGPATAAQVRTPFGLAADGKGNLYIADYADHRVRRVDLSGKITTLAGIRAGGFSGDGGPATSAMLFGPRSLALDAQGNVYIGDGQNYRVRKITVGTQAAALKLTLGGASGQRLLARQGVTITAKTDQSCTFAATAKLTIIGTDDVFVLAPASAKLAAAGSRTLTLRLPVAVRARFRQLWKPGLKARVTITVRATDNAGRRRSATRIVTVLR
jgi:sugar lactone lactonase YvrE